MSSINDHDINVALDAMVAAANVMSVGLSTTEPIRNTGVSAGFSNISEPPTAAGYAQVTLLASEWSAASNRIKATSVDIDFPAPTGDWGEVGWVVVWAGSRVMFTGDLGELIDITDGGDSLTIPAGTLSLYFPA